MRNWLRVTEHVRAALVRARVSEPERRCLRAILARSGGPLHAAPDGALWRAFAFIEGARSAEVPESPAQAEAAARAFGAFVAQLVDLDPATLGEPIPRFHDFPHRLAALEAAVADDAHGRLAPAGETVERARRLAADVQRALAEAGASALPRRVVHNDCKLNNVLFDARTGEALCVIDLDTVMPGHLLADFGDLVRTAACYAPEDTRDVAGIRVEPDLYQALADGYLAGAASLVTAAECELLPVAGPLIALELALRFATDHLGGDLYFRAAHPGHNLDRARSQLRLAEQLLDDLSGAHATLRRAARSAGFR
jgi:Ser/Thr protein kinase RdoA (MazF antagonist)